MKIADWDSRFSVVFRPRSLAVIRAMEAKRGLWLLVSAYLIALSLALPSSLVEEIKNSEIKSNKVKRAHPDRSEPEETIGKVSYFNKATSAIKRGTNLKPQESDIPNWNGEQLYRGGNFGMDNVQSGLFSSPLDDKSLAEYEKGYRYATNKDKLDEALENAVLKGELYGEPYNQYRYYGTDDRRKRRDTSKQRPKRNIDLTPDEVLALLTLYENNHKTLKESENYRQPIMRYNKNYDPDDFDGDNDETWLNAAAYPHATIDNDMSDNFLLDYANPPPQPEYRSHWGNFDNAKKKRFLVAKKRTADPTRMIRYINGPSENDFNTLSSIINNQKESKLNVPVYRRLVL